jgi:hypothetical protein
MNQTRKRLARAAAIAGAAVIVYWLFWWGRPPQMGGDKEAAKAVDALFTAVTARDAKLLGECEQRLRAHRAGGNLAPAASAYLDEIVSEARRGQWQSAAERLFEFMKAQRREAIRTRERG